ncbi:hypothetical protein [Streptomyces sp. NPDC059349]|uniref:hypothetical protein n=1 Tax=Streptomyces sp. NPDC059349 TaxID=3346808 RepID=UPI0036D1772F
MNVAFEEGFLAAGGEQHARPTKIAIELSSEQRLAASGGMGIATIRDGVFVGGSEGLPGVEPGPSCRRASMICTAPRFWSKPLKGVVIHGGVGRETTNSLRSCRIATASLRGRRMSREDISIAGFNSVPGGGDCGGGRVQLGTEAATGEDQESHGDHE